MEDLAGAAADGVDDDVEAPEAVDGLLDDAVGVGLVGRVAGDREALRAGRRDPSDRLVERVLGAAGDRDLRAGAREASARAEPIAPPPPGMRATRPSRLNMSSAVIVLL